MNILFYSSFNSRARDAETLMYAFKKQGHKVISLTQADGKPINEVLAEQGIKALSYNPSTKNRLVSIIKHIIHLVRVCSQEDIDIVYCHLEPASFVGVLSQYFIRAKVFLCRHHIDEALLYNFNSSFSYKLTYYLANKIIVVSKQAKDFMVSQEGIPAHKIIHINLAYDFSLFTPPRPDNVEFIRKKFNCSVLLITVGRLTKFKRPDLSIAVLKELIAGGVDAKLILLGQGEMIETLKKVVAQDQLEAKVIFPGFVDNVLEYMAASAFLLHPSVLESSCVVVKEAALIGLPVLVCKGVGDFDEYLMNGENSFVLNKENFVEEAVDAIKRNIPKTTQIDQMASNLKNNVIKSFSIEHLIHHYDLIHGMHSYVSTKT